MSKILHHNDDDGRCAAYLTKRHINTVRPMEIIQPTDFIEYNYNGDLEKRYPELHENEMVYIVDISMCKSVHAFIDYCIEHGAIVVHIDHHDSGIKYYEEHKEAFAIHEANEKYFPFMKNGISGAMLTWIYSDIFTDENRKNPNSVKFEFDDDALRRRCCLVDNEGCPVDKKGEKINTERLITLVPDALRFIDDNDIWKHKIVETRAFCAGFGLSESKHPLNHIWDSLFDETDPKEQAVFMENMINNGTVIIKYKELTDARNLSNGFYANVNGVDVCFLNAIAGNSLIFQDMYDNSEAVCKFNFDGTKWWYTFYSDEATGANCNALIQYLVNKYGEECGALSYGGHIHAAGCTFTKNFVDKLEIDKTAFIEKRKQIRIDKEVAAEQARIAAAEAKLREDNEKLARLRAKVAAQIEDDEDYGF